jgi:hypothetical protein
VAPYNFLKSIKHTFQSRNPVHWSLVRNMKLTDMYITGFGESEIVTQKCVTVVAMATVTFQNGCSFAFKIQWSAHSRTQSPSYARSTDGDEGLWPNPYQTGIWLATMKVIVLITYISFTMFLWFPVLARAPRRTARKKGSGYENVVSGIQRHKWFAISRPLGAVAFKCLKITPLLGGKLWYNPPVYPHIYPTLSRGYPPRARRW